MEIKKYKIDEDEYIFVENVIIGFLKIIRCISKDGKNIFLRKYKDSYKKIENKMLLSILNKKFNYEIKTDICEKNNEK